MQGLRAHIRGMSSAELADFRRLARRHQTQLKQMTAEELSDYYWAILKDRASLEALIPTKLPASEVRNEMSRLTNKIFTRVYAINRGRPAEHDLTKLRVYYAQLLPIWQHAKKVFRRNKDLSSWRSTVENELQSSFKAAKVRAVQNDDLNKLIDRLPGLSGDQQKALKDRQLTASPSEAAWDHAALLCGVPLYHYTLRYLQTWQRRKKPTRKTPK